MSGADNGLGPLVSDAYIRRKYMISDQMRVYEIPAEFHTSGSCHESPPKMRGIRQQITTGHRVKCIWCGNDFEDDGTGACNSCYGPRDGKLWLP